ncbi:MAG TPA: 50S ribosomal protein L22 [Candidatus Obscuribacterales bacterium]
MHSKAQTKWLRMSPRKVRRVIDEIRGKTAAEAVTILRFMPYSAAREVEKVLKSAMYNLVHAEKSPITEAEANELRIVEAYADQGPTLKRIQPRARGRWYPILKKSSHVTLVLSDV